jgi:pimeloyl-ACP methyl ester carboxylesterase
VVTLASGAEARLRNEEGRHLAVLVNGGTARAEPGTWSATSELLADQLEPRFPGVTLLEVRYRVKTWKELSSCVADAEAAVEHADGRPTLLIGFSMGGAVAIAVSGRGSVAAVLGLAPWIPEPLPLEGLEGKRLDIVHGEWDRYLPGVPGVKPESSRAGFDRALAAGAHGTYTLVRRGLHGCAVRSPTGRLVRLPRWRDWVAHTAAAVARFVDAT